ncbi:MAG TPA: DnaJ domain-containing protein, partial [Chloroflexota bacterium]
MTDSDYYAVLGVDAKAPPEVIKAAYHALARKYHPDTNPGTPLLGTQFQEITRAHEILSDPLRRAAYDVSREAARARQAPP